MPELSSRAISRAEYDAATSVLTVWFAESGQAWDHFAVPASVYESLIAAEAPGRYFAEVIRDRFPARRRKATSQTSDLAAALRQSL